MTEWILILILNLPTPLMTIPYLESRTQCEKLADHLSITLPKGTIMQATCINSSKATP